MNFFTRIAPAKKISRFWLSIITPTLLGEWSLFREWGRLGSPGTVQTKTFEREDDARRAEQRGIRKRERHGYAETQDVVSRWQQLLATGGSIHAPEKRSQIKSKNSGYSANDNQGRLDF